MKISAQTVAHSLSPQGIPLWTGLIVLPRFILAELNTHRMLSKNSASSRAIPTRKLVDMIRDNPFIPIAWQKEHKGMQGTEYLSKVNSQKAEGSWLVCRDRAIQEAEYLLETGVTKQLINRILEPFMYHTVLISGTEWENFFELRCPQYEFPALKGKTFRSKKDVMKDTHFANSLSDMDWLLANKGQAEIHMMALAEAIWDAMNESKPRQLQAGEWHIPFEDKIPSESDLLTTYKLENYRLDDGGLTHLDPCGKIKIATGMAARTSYTTVGDEKEVSYETLLEIHDKMAIARPFHASPFEHCAKAMSYEEYEMNVKGELEWTRGQYSMPLIKNSESGEGWCRNYRGFIQYRHILEEQVKVSE